MGATILTLDKGSAETFAAADATLANPSDPLPMTVSMSRPGSG
jgi:hypothetical protein